MIPRIEVEGSAYEGVRGETISDEDGWLRIASDVFGGPSLLSVAVADRAPVQVPIAIDWAQPTTATIELGALTVPREPEGLAGTYLIEIDGDGCFDDMAWFFCELTADDSGVLTQSEYCSLEAVASGQVTARSAHIEWLVDYTDYRQEGRYDGTRSDDGSGPRTWDGSASYTLTYAYTGTTPTSCTRTARSAWLTYTAP